ncbi:MAG: hypothetical protein WA790_15800 [Sulfitobacter sp.]
MDIETLITANKNRARLEEVEKALEFWRGGKNQDNVNYRLHLSYLPGNWKNAPQAARLTEAEMVGIRAAKIHALESEIEDLNTSFGEITCEP